MTKQEFEDARAALDPGDIETALKVIPVAATALQFTQQVDRYYRYIRELVPGRLVFDTDDGYRVTVSVSVEQLPLQSLYVHNIVDLQPDQGTPSTIFTEKQ